MDPNPIWSITGGAGDTAINPETGKLTVSKDQPAGPITVTATVGGLSASATVTVKIVSDLNGYDQQAKWAVYPFKLGDVALTGDDLWTKNQDITLRYIMQADREERHLKMFYMTAGIRQLPVAVGPRAAGSNVSAMTNPHGWDGVGYATTSTIYQRALSGHASGHYLTALAHAYQTTRSESQKSTLLAKMRLMVDQLGYIQDTNIEKGSYMYGFLSAYTEHQFDVLEENKAQVQGNSGSSTRSAWAIFYTQHKIIQGLVDIYKLLKGTEDEATAQRALEIATKMGDWTYLRLNRWTQADRENMWNVYSDGEIGGIAQPILDLYFITGDELYRETASFFEHNNNWNNSGSAGQSLTNTDGYWVRPGTVRATTRSGDGFFAHFAKGREGTWLNSKHANTIIPMIVGALRQYEADQPVNRAEDIARINPVGYTPARSHYYDVAKNFFYHILESRISPIGGSASGEIYHNFGNPVTPSWNAHLSVGTSGGSNESCTTYNNMMLAYSLFRHEQQAEYIDYYEKALYNHILSTLAQNSTATQNRIDYLMHMGTNATRNYDRYGDGACCNGTGYEAHVRYQEHAYYKTRDGNCLYVNLYMPTTLNWAEKGFQIVQTGDYLNKGEAKLTVNGNGPLDIMLRVPYWVEKGFEVKVNGEVAVENAAKSSYVKISREWKTGDVIEIDMPFSVRIERSPENTTGTTAVLFYGPYIMVQLPGNSARPTISGLNLNDLDAEFTVGEEPTSRTRSATTHHSALFAAVRTIIRFTAQVLPLLRAARPIA